VFHRCRWQRVEDRGCEVQPETHLDERLHRDRLRYRLVAHSSPSPSIRYLGVLVKSVFLSNSASSTAWCC
jgi:hypothetical protein